MDLQLRDQVALVTAASRGLGFAVADTLAAEGARVVMASRSDAIKTAAERIAHGKIHPPVALQADLSKRQDIDHLVQKTLEHYGHIDILFINAGGPDPGNFSQIDVNQWEAGMNLTIMSAVLLCRAVVPVMLRQQRGSIVASQSMSVKQPVENLTLSNALRPAVVGLMKSLADELGPSGIRVNTIHPGWTRTERVDQLVKNRCRTNGTTEAEEMEKITRAIPLGRIGTPEEFACAAAWLASPAAAFIHGQALVIDGGETRFPL
ncbi:MAG: SDR family oxidoreductase [Acidobacteriota bacterium]|jgi:3-oxoacyl-[acyl-carrier protein] reductase|nr:SDR family oxidoreductase [Acidobacteriota bacterium]